MVGVPWNHKVGIARKVVHYKVIIDHQIAIMCWTAQDTLVKECNTKLLQMMHLACHVDDTGNVSCQFVQ